MKLNIPKSGTGALSLFDGSGGGLFGLSNATVANDKKFSMFGSINSFLSSQPVINSGNSIFESKQEEEKIPALFNHSEPKKPAIAEFKGFGSSCFPATTML